MKLTNGDIFEKDDPIRYGADRHRQNLFIRRLLHKASLQTKFKDEAYQSAYRIICKWADLEESKKLERKKETTLEVDFFGEVFQQALGYTPLSANQEEWYIEPKFPVSGGIVDAVLGIFRANFKPQPLVAVEIKGPKVNLDRDRSSGRTAVQQCRDYLASLEGCEWGIVSNIVSFRLYHRNKSWQSFELFALKDLKNAENFAKFYYLFQRDGLLSLDSRESRAARLLKETGDRQREVEDDLYLQYDNHRRDLILHLSGPKYKKSHESALRIAQLLLDRIIFIAFCEDRELIPAESIIRARKHKSPYSRVTNPQWQNFLELFQSIDKGHEQAQIPAFNGGLYRSDEEVDNLQLEDTWTDFFETIASYDFRDEVSVEVLGRLFEKSVKDIEVIKLGGLLGTTVIHDAKAKMAKSPERKRQGIYYTPPEFTDYIVKATILPVFQQRTALVAKQLGVDQDKIRISDREPLLANYGRHCLAALRDLKIVDPACGSGAFLIAAYDLLEDLYTGIIDLITFHEGSNDNDLGGQISDFILHDNIHGVDLSKEAVEISQLALWIRSARPGKTLADLSKNVVHGNSLVSDPQVDAAAFDWKLQFPDVFDRKDPGFDCVIGNPPWERMKLQEREYFDSISPDIASAVDAATRRRLIEQLEQTNPEVHDRYQAAKSVAERNLAYIRNSERFPLTGRGDINTYAIFAELAHSIVSGTGRVGLLVPSGIATDNTTKDFFATIVDTKSLIGLYDFENKLPIFQDVHRSFKFSILIFGGSNTSVSESDFVFFAHRIEDLADSSKHIALTPDDIKLLNPNTRTCPIFRSNRDAEITKAIYRRVPILIDHGREEGGNPWGIRFFTMFHQTNDAEHFVTGEKLKADGFKLKGNHWLRGKSRYLPLYEAKMMRPYDHRFGSVFIKVENWMNQGQTHETNVSQHENPEYLVQPRWWAEESVIANRLGGKLQPAFLSFRDVTRTTDRRTVLPTFIPISGVLNKLPIIQFDQSTAVRLQCCFQANLYSLPLDYVARQKIGSISLNFFIFEQFPILTPDRYQQPCPWNRKLKLENWISDRVLKLTCTANDMIPLAEAAGFDPPVHKWNERERADLMAELDAAYFILYEIERDDVEYILSTFKGGGADEDMFGGKGIAFRILDQYDKLRKAM
ncbi:MAG: DNA methyltransferase [Candidatus Zixiibacteriota bacterium]